MELYVKIAFLVTVYIYCQGAADNFMGYQSHIDEITVLYCILYNFHKIQLRMGAWAGILFLS